jgi:serine/threonine protein kinase
MPTIPARILELSPTDRLQLEAWLAEFEETWDEHRLAAQVERLPPPGQPLRLPALIELVKIDLERNWQRGRHLTLADYLARYPELGPAEALPTDLQQAEDEVRRQFAELPATLPAAPIAERVGSVIGPYKLMEQIGEGGFGLVFIAEQHEPVRRKVALKLLKPGMDSAQIIARFEQERQALALMDHANIARVLDAGTTPQGRPYFVMELVKGIALTKYCDQEHLDPRERLMLFIPVCQAVQHAHQKGIIHRDLKPSNVLVGLYDGRPVPKVIDFGVAKATAQTLTERTVFTEVGQVIGTLEYMAPEQAELNNLDVDTRADVYSLGALLYELLTGSPPFSRQQLRGGALGEVLRLIREVEPPRLSTKLSSSTELPAIAARRKLEPNRLRRLVQGELDWIVMKCLEKDRARRYETANGLADDLERYLHNEPVQAGPPSAAYRLRKLARKYWAQLSAAAVCCTLLVAGTAVSAWQALRATTAQTEAAAERDRAVAAEAEVRAQRDMALAAEATAQEQRRRADEQAAIARAVNEFLQEDLLRQATSRDQADRGRIADPDLTVRDALNRAAACIGDRFHEQPLVEAAIRQTIGEGLFETGAAAQAIPHLEQALALRTAKQGPQHRSTLEALNALGIAQLHAGRVPEAVATLERALEQRRAVIGPDHPDTLVSMNCLAIGLLDMGRSKEAVDLLEPTVEHRKRRLGIDHVATLTSMNNLALAYEKANRLDDALALHERTLELRKARLGLDHPDTLASLNNVAMAYLKAGRAKDAVPLLEDALRRRRAVLGPDDPHTLTTLANLAAAHGYAGRPKDALPLYAEALERRRAKLGADHPHTLASMSDLALGYKRVGRTKEAIPLYEEALRLRRAKLGADHPQTLTTLGNLAVAYDEAGRRADALPLYEEVVERRRATLGPEHPTTLMCLGNLAIAYSRRGETDRAIKLLEQVYTHLAKRGADHPDALAAMRNLASIYDRAGRTADAVRLYEESVRRCRVKQGDDHPDTLSALGGLASAYLSAKQFPEALAVAKEVLERSTAKLGEANPSTIINMNTLAIAYKAVGRPADAVPLLERAAKLMTTARGADHPDALALTNNLAAAYETIRQYDRAEAPYRAVLTACRRKPEPTALAGALAALGSNLLRQERYADAEALLRECLDIRKGHQPANWQTSDARSALGASLLGQKHYAEAEPLLTEGYRGLKDVAATIPAPMRTQRLSEAVDRLVRLYEATGNQEQAAKWRQERETVTRPPAAKSAPASSTK